MGSTMQEVARPTINWGGGSSLMDSGANAPRKLIWAILLALTLAITAVLALPHEAHAVEVGDFEVTGGALNTDYTYSSNVFTIKTDTPLTISMKVPGGETTNDAILVDAGEGTTAQVTLQDVKVDMTAKFNTAAMSVQSGSLALVLPEGTENSLKSGSWHAGLENGENPLTISGDGKLVATGGSGGAGIGGSSGTGSKIKIEGSATVEATGGEFAAGIGGGGSGGSGKGITISGYATVTARGGASGAGIGGGNRGTGSEITIDDSARVVATGGIHGAGIGGGGTSGTGTGITIKGTTKVEATGGTDGAGIGGGNGGSGTGIKIEGSATVEATGGSGGAGIGGGSSGTGVEITISGFATVTAKGGTSGAGIGGGNKDSGSKIKIEGSATVEATGGGRGAGIGGGDGGSGTDDITIKDSATVTAKGGDFAAGIGGGDGGSGSNIFIAGGYVKATAGARGSAQPIGNGYNASGTASVSITGGAFADTGWSAEKVYGIAPASGYFPDDNNEEASEADYPVRVYKLGAVTLELEDAMTFEYVKTPVSSSDILKTAKRDGTDAGPPVEWSYRLKDSTGAYESGTPTDAGVYEVLVVLPAFTDTTTSTHYPEKTAFSNVTITQGAASLDLSVDETDASYGDKVTFTLTPQVAPAPSVRSATTPKVEFFVGDPDKGGKKLGEVTTGVAEGAKVSFEYDTSSKGLTIGANTVFARVTGLNNLAEATEQVEVTLAPKALNPSASATGTVSKVYDGTVDVPVGVLSITLDNVLSGDNVAASASFAFASASAGTTQVNATEIALSGADAGWYVLSAETASISVTGGIVPIDAFDVHTTATMPNYLPDHEVRIDLEALPGLPTDVGGTPVFSVDAFASYSGLSSVRIEGNELVLVAKGEGSSTSDTVIVSVTGMVNYKNPSTVSVAVSYTDKPTADLSAIQASGATAGGTYRGASYVGFDALAGATYVALDGTTMTYTGPFEVSYQGIGAISYGPTSQPPTAAGVYIVTASLPAEAPCAGSAVVSFEIAKAPLTVTALGAAAVYGETLPSLSVSFAGFVANESEDVLSGKLLLSCSYAAGDPVGTYAVAASGLAAANYAITYVPDALTVSPKALSAKVDSAGPSASKVYDGKGTFTGVKLTLSDIIAGDDVSATAEGTAADAKVGSSKAFSASSVSLSGAAAGNYTLATSDVTGTVTIKAATPIPLPPPDGKDAASGGSTLAPTGDTTFGSALVALTLAIASAATLAVVRFRRRTN